MVYAIATAWTIVSFLIGFFVSQKARNAKLVSPLRRLNELSSNIAATSSQLGSVSQEITTATHEQLDTLNSTVSASHEIRSMIEKTTENAHQLENHAEHLKSLVASGNTIISKMVASSKDIKIGMDHFQVEMQERMASLTQALKVIQEIASKTQVINEIVFQTKLLSFNASVEAARAGESGKGFSVVAEEVGKLAVMSGTAANEISQIVARSIEVMDQAITTTRNKIEALTRETILGSEVGVNTANECAGIFHNMEAKISETVEMIKGITIATTEQAAGVSQLDQSMVKFQEAADRNRLIASQATEQINEFEKQTDALTSLATGCVATLGLQETTKNKTYNLFTWDDRYLLNVPQMDNEHRVLIGKINGLIEALKEHNDSPNLPNVKAAFTELANYTVKHFDDEEKYMESVGYPQLESHRRIHHKLLSQVGDIAKQLDNGTLDDLKTIAFVRDWIVSHILGVDMQYGKHAQGFRRSA